MEMRNVFWVPWNVKTGTLTISIVEPNLLLGPAWIPITRKFPVIMRILVLVT